jgi:hypothetical protein
MEDTQWVYDRLVGISDGSLQGITIRELRKMIRIMQGNNSILEHISESNLNRNINTYRIQGISIQMIMPLSNIRQRQNIKTRWISAIKYAIRVHSLTNSISNSNSNNTRSINSKKSSGTKLSTPTRKRLKKTPTTPQSKLKK